MRHTYKYGTTLINYKLIKAKRKTMVITVYPNKEVVVKVPEGKTENEINDKLNKKAAWITKQLKYFDSLPPIPEARKFVSGETHRYLGKQYRLKILKADSKQVVLKGGYIYISLPDTTDKKGIEKLLKRWYRTHAKKRFENYLSESFMGMKKYGIPYPNLVIREMKTCWGSCNKSGKITLNLNLIKHSSLCIHYVIVHELCHLKYHNHSRDFYKLLKKVIPDWERRKYKLNHEEI